MADEYSEMNPSEIAADIGKELFSSGEEAAGEETAPPEAPALGETAPAIADPKPGLTAAQIRALPKSWKKDMDGYWQKLPPQVHDYVYEREENVMRGLQQYGEWHNRWNSLVQPYTQLLQQNPGIDPVQLMQGLMNSHLRMLGSNPQERRALAAQMLSAYGIDIGPEPGQQGTPEDSPALRQALANTQMLERRLAQMEGGWRSQQEAMQNAILAENTKKVEEFASAPTTKYWDEVSNDILRFLKTGAATDLPSAYELACYANPAVRAKILAEQQASAPPTVPAKAGVSPFPNINGSGETTPRRQRKGSIEDTINGIVSKHYGQH